jgi:hypothetical protein
MKTETHSPQVVSGNPFSPTGSGSTGQFIRGAVIGGFIVRMELQQLVQSLQKRADRLARKQRRFLAAAGRRISVGRMANR